MDNPMSSRKMANRRGDVIVSNDHDEDVYTGDGDIISVDVNATSSNATSSNITSSNATDNSDLNDGAFDIGPTTLYTCGDASIGGSVLSEGEGTAGNINALELTFDYELHTVPGVAAMEALSGLESAMLDDVAGEVGLIDCRVRTRRRTLRSSRREEVLADDVVGISSVPEDVPDEDTDECDVAVDLGSPTTCTPFKGYMTVYVNNEVDGLVTERKMLGLVRDGMRDDRYNSEDILKVSFIGTRTQGGGGNRASGGQEVSSDAESGSSISGLGVGLICAAVALTFLLVLALFVTRRTKMKDHINMDEIDPVKRNFDDDIADSCAEQSDRSVVRDDSRYREGYDADPESLSAMDSLALAKPAETVEESFSDTDSYSDGSGGQLVEDDYIEYHPITDNKNEQL